ncbi:MAG: hypothetical protein SPJ34_04085 [Candidatus Ornithospirochaeta sp.]|nr:hypothetical protein [Candidatus Ornithospirochaeta sp.]
MDNLIISFLVYSFFGYLCEVVYCSVGQRRLVNRGFLYGPYLPIYGCGALVIKICLLPLFDHPLLVFLFGMILTSAIEYVTSWGLEKLFSVKLWDYSKKKVNINGRVCLLNSTLFGLLGLVAVYLVEPRLNAFINAIPEVLQNALAKLIVIVFAVDTTLSVVKMSAFKAALAEAREKAEEIQARARELAKEGKAELAEQISQNLNADLERFKDSIRKRYRHIVNANPGITSRHDEIKMQLELLDQWYQERRRLKKQLKIDLKENNRKYAEQARRAGKNG